MRLFHILWIFLLIQVYALNIQVEQTGNTITFSISDKNITATNITVALFKEKNQIYAERFIDQELPFKKTISLYEDGTYKIVAITPESSASLIFTKLPVKKTTPKEENSNKLPLLISILVLLAVIFYLLYYMYSSLHKKNA